MNYWALSGLAKARTLRGEGRLKVGPQPEMPPIGFETLQTAAKRVAGSPQRRVMMLSTDLGFGGGAEEQVMALSLGLRARGWQVGIVSLTPPSPLPAEIEASDIKIDSLRMRRGVPDPRAIMTLRQQLRRWRPDVLHSHMTHANLLARIVRPLQPVPVLINTLHSVRIEKVSGGSGRLLAIGHRLTDGLTDLTTVVCGAAERHYLSSGTVRPGRIAVIHNGIDTGAYQFDPLARRRMRALLDIDDRFVWLAAGRLEKAKDHATLLRAFAEFRSHRNDDSVLLICGQGSLQVQLRALAQQLGLGEQVRFLGVHKKMAEMYSAADALVISSVREGLPMVLLEASACGRPTVATAVGGIPEVLLEGVTGYLSPAHNEMALASAMERMARRSSAERTMMGESARLHVLDNFDMNNVLDRWEALYLELLRRSCPPR